MSIHIIVQFGSDTKKECNYFAMFHRYYKILPNSPAIYFDPFFLSDD